MADWSLLMDSFARHPIDKSPWPGFSREPKTSFSIAYQENSIFLKFYVNERHPRITYHDANDPVYKDSCVEFFISFDQGRSYYNLECNAIGTCLMGYGLAHEKRSYQPATLIQAIGYYSSLQGLQVFSSEDESWSLTLKIPLEIFVHDSINALSGTSAKANFYKCGDECAAPHYLAWNTIITPGPDFHQPGFFGELLFL